MKVTIKDIAQKTNYSAKTVSRVINSDPLVRDSTREEILKAIKELGYRPNIIARSLRQQKTNMLGFIIPDILNPAFPMLFEGATGIFDSNGYYAFLSCSDNNAQKEDEFIRDFNSMLISGLILIPSISEGRSLEIFEEIPTPVILLDREIDGLERDIILFSNKVGAYDATKYLINCGHKKIVILCGSLNLKTTQNRIKGWEIAMKGDNLYSTELQFNGTYSIDSGFEMMNKAIGTIKKVDAVFCCNDIIAIGAIEAIRKAGLMVPEDISVFGFDDIYMSQFLKPPLTTVRQPLKEAGRVSAMTLLDRINGVKKGPYERIVLKTELVLRETVVKK